MTVQQRRWVQGFFAGICVLLCCVGLFALSGCWGEDSGDETSTSFVEEVDEPVFTTPFYVLLVGNDTRTGTVDSEQAGYADGSARSDVMMLMRIDPVNYQITLISIPRDTATTIDGELAKINTAYQISGIEGAIDQSELLTGVSIDYYFDLNFITFEELIDAIGGITVDVPVSMSLQDIVGGENITLSSGVQDLNGAQALVLSRTRKVYSENQDAIRQVQNRAIVVAGITKIVQNPDMSATAISALIQCAETNMTEDELEVLVNAFVEHGDELVIYQATGPYVGGEDSSTGLWVATRDEETWAQIIAVADAGEDPSGIVELPSLPYE